MRYLVSKVSHQQIAAELCDQRVPCRGCYSGFFLPGRGQNAVDFGMASSLPCARSDRDPAVRCELRPAEGW
jgi:hypothetical protein